MYKIDLRTATWTGALECHELFDHQDTVSIAYQRFDIKENVRLSQNPTSLKIITSTIKSKLVGVPLFELFLQPDSIKLKPMKKEGDPWSIYQLVPSEKSISELKVKKGDTLKLGTATVTIVQTYRTPKIRTETLHYSNSVVSYLESEQTIESTRSLESSKFRTAELENSPVCRFCLGHSSSLSNPIISVCSCTGSSKFIHSKCLEIWLRDRLTVTPCKSSFVTALSRKGCRCQLCLKFYDFRVLLQVKTDQFPSNYCVVDVSCDKDNLYLLDFSKTSEIVIGRGHLSDLSVNNETISRRHCKILYDEKKCKFYVTDLASKFGTLLGNDQSSDAELCFNDSVILQVDRHIFYLNKIQKRGLLTRMFSFCNYQKDFECEKEDDDQGWLRER